MASFPKGWFYIKNRKNNYCLSTEKLTAGEPLVISTLATQKTENKDLNSQLWQYGSDKRLHNKRTGFVLDVAKGVATPGADVVQQEESETSEYQQFGLTADGHIYLLKNPKLVLGIKESFFTRRDGQHIHLQTLNPNEEQNNEQRWDFTFRIVKRAEQSGPISSLKGTTSGASLATHSASIEEPKKEVFLQENMNINQGSPTETNFFPKFNEFVLQSMVTGLVVGVDYNAKNSSGARVYLESFRENDCFTQTWFYDHITGRLINKHSGFALTAEEVGNHSYLCQSANMTVKELPSQCWIRDSHNEIKLNVSNYVLSYANKTWFNMNRGGSPALLQKKSPGIVLGQHMFNVLEPVSYQSSIHALIGNKVVGTFPDVPFFISNNSKRIVMTVEETETLASRIIGLPVDPTNYNRQLWKYENGFLINMASQMVLDIRGGCIVNGSELCQYKRKSEGFENQQWNISNDGYLYSKTRPGLVLSFSSHEQEEYPLQLVNKKTPDNENQRWNFRIPQYKNVKTKTETVQKSIAYHRYMEYPSGYFFIRSHLKEAPKTCPFVLTADITSRKIYLAEVSKNSWHTQLWTYLDGSLINFSTRLAIQIDSIDVGSGIHQDSRRPGSVSQTWYLSVEGYIIHSSNPTFTLIPQCNPDSQSEYDMRISTHTAANKDHSWSLMAPKTTMNNGIEVLTQFYTQPLNEWKRSDKEIVQNITQRIVYWPEDTFFINFGGLALVPERSEAYSYVTVKKFLYGQSENFKWAYRNGYLVHVATGLVLHASDNLIGGSQLHIREKLLAGPDTIDPRQRWVLKTDGAIVCENNMFLGIGLFEKGGRCHVMLSHFTSSHNEHCNWRIVRGRYETRYSDIYKKEVSIVTNLIPLVLVVMTDKPALHHNRTKLVTRSVGVFPENWFFIRSEADKTLVLTSPSEEQGSKLILSKIDLQNFRHQLWHVQDDGCLINLESNQVIDVAGGALISGSNIIQWHEKFLRRYRKNQTWGLSVEGHIYPRSRPGLVLSPKGSSAVEGAEIKLHARGPLGLQHQLWSFVAPVFGMLNDGVKSVSSAGVLEKNDSSVCVDKVEDAPIKTSVTESYERETKKRVLRRWSSFPEDGFFIRVNYGNEKLALTVEKNARTVENGRTEYEVTLRPMQYIEHRWHLWLYQDGHLINAQTGLALDASPTMGVLVEDGLRNPLFVRDKSMSDHQFWSLSTEGDIYLRSDEHLVVGVSNARRATVSGAQVGLRELHVRKYMNENNQEETSIKSETWLKWAFSKPVYPSKTSSASNSISVSVQTEATGLVGSGESMDDTTDLNLTVKEREESADDNSDSTSSNNGSEIKANIPHEDTSVTGKVNSESVKLSEVAASAPGAITTTDAGSSEETAKQSVTKKTSYTSIKYDRKDSFHENIDYLPTGFEKIVRFKTHQKPNFPQSGYFMIKSQLHGFVFDIANGQPKDGAFVVLAPIKTTDFASQLWSYDEGQIVNLKGHNLVLDATVNDTVTAGEKLVVSTKKSAVTSIGQHWEFGTDGGLILVSSRRNFVLGVKELKRVTSPNATIDVYIQEEKPHPKSNLARSEQRWEIKVPSLIPIEQTTSITDESKYTVIENGKINSVTSCASAIIAFDWIKHTYQHKVTVDNQWPSSQSWFFVRIGGENAFLSSGSNDSSEVKFVSLDEKQDHKQFLWVYMNGYLINYKYMLRLVYDDSSKKLLLSKDTKTLDQTFIISSKGNIRIKLKSEVIYVNVSSGQPHSYELNPSKEEFSFQEHSVQLHIPVFSDAEIERESKVALSTVTSWVRSSQVTTTTTSSTITTYVSQRYGIFPVGTWFFLKSLTNEGNTLVMAVEGESHKSGASLILKKLNFKDYQSQLWTYRDGLLINYGSKYVIDVSGEVTESAKLIQSAEAGVSSQKWALTASGNIQLGSYYQYALGYTASESIREDLEIVLVDRESSSDSHIITWRFSVPIFGKVSVESGSSNVATLTTTTSVSAIERLSSYIEAGAVIESIEEADIKVEDISVKKNNAIDNSSKSSTAVIAKEKHHGFQEMLISVGIAVTAGAIAIGAVGGSNVSDKVSEKHEEKTSEQVQAGAKKAEGSITSSTSDDVESTQSTTSSKATLIDEKSNTTSSVASETKKAITTVTVRRSQRTSVQIIEESRVIVRAWKIVFSQRIHRCKTNAELVQIIEESREELFRRLDEHLRVHASVEHLISGAVPEWHVTIQQVKEIYRARIFEKFLDSLKSKEITSSAQLDFDSVLSSSSEEIENHYNLAIENQTKILSESDSSSSDQSVTSTEESLIQENALLAIGIIKANVRYWLIGLRDIVSAARSKGSSEEEINIIIENSRKDLSTQLTEIKTTVSEHLKKSSSLVLGFKKSSIASSIDNAIKQTETVVSYQVTKVYSKQQSIITEEHWSEIYRLTEEALSNKLKVYQTAITQEISEVQKLEIQKSDQAEISVVLDEKMVSVAQQTISNKLLETQNKFLSWFTELFQQVSWLLEGSETFSTDITEVKKNTLAIIEAAQVELATHIEETKLVVRAYYAHLTFLSWAERHRIEYSLDDIKASVIANINCFKQSIEKEDITKDQINRYLSYSFDATVSRSVISDIQSIVVKVTSIHEFTTVVNKISEVEAENTKASTISETSNANSSSSSKITGSTTTTGNIEISKSTTAGTSLETEATNVEDVKKVENVGQQNKIDDKIESEVEETKIGKIGSNQWSSTTSVDRQKESSSSVAGKVTTATLGAAAAAITATAIVDQHESKEEFKKPESVSDSSSKVSTAVTEKPAQASVIIGNDSKVIHAEKQQTMPSSITKQEKTDALVFTHEEIQVTIHGWLDSLSKRVYECAKKQSADTKQEIDSIVFESQQQLVNEIEKAERNTISVIGTSQTSFHDTLNWVRSTVWKQVSEVKQIGYEIAASITEYEKKLESIKKATFEQVDSAIEKSKASASVMQVVGYESSAVIDAGKTFEDVDYSKTAYGESIETTNVVVEAADAAIACTAIVHQHESNEKFKKPESVSDSSSKVSTAVTEKPAQASVIIGNDSKVIHAENQQTMPSSVTKQEKTDALVVTHEEIQVTIHGWLDSLSKRVYECAKKQSADTKQEIDSIVFESQQQLVNEIEKAERNTTSVIGTSQTSFHDTLNWVRSTVWKQVSEVKQIGYEIATSITEYEKKLETIKKATFEQVDSAIEKSKASASVMQVVGYESSAVIDAGKKFEDVDYSKTAYGESIETTNVVVEAADAAIACTAIVHQHESKEEFKKPESVSDSSSKVSIAVTEKPAQASVIIGNDSKVIHAEKQQTMPSRVTKQEKTDALVVTHEEIQVTIHEWLDSLSKRVYECAKKQSADTKQEIDSIVFESQQQLVNEIEKAERNTTSVIGTSQASFHDTLNWVTSTVWKQVSEVKQIGYEIACSNSTSVTEYEKKLETIKKDTLELVDSAIEKSKASASVMHVVGHESSAVIDAGKTFEDVDYSKTAYGESIETTKVVVEDADAVIACTAIVDHQESKEEFKKPESVSDSSSKVSTAVTEKSAQASVIIGNDSKVIHAENQQTVTSGVTKQEKTDALVVTHEEIQVTIHEWLDSLSKRVYECAKKQSGDTKQGIDSIVFDSQQQLVNEIEKAERNTTSVIGTSQTSFHDTLNWVRSTVWKQVSEVKQIGYEIAASITEYEKKLESIKKATFEQVDSAIEKSKASASVMHVAGYESSAVIDAGKKFEDVDYSKTAYGESVETTNVMVEVLIEETHTSVQRI